MHNVSRISKDKKIFSFYKDARLQGRRPIYLQPWFHWWVKGQGHSQGSHEDPMYRRQLKWLTWHEKVSRFDTLYDRGHLAVYTRTYRSRHGGCCGYYRVPWTVAMVILHTHVARSMQGFPYPKVGHIQVDTHTSCRHEAHFGSKHPYTKTDYFDTLKLHTAPSDSFFLLSDQNGTEYFKLKKIPLLMT